MEIGEDRWVCGTCRSINSRRSDHCYRCHAPRIVAEVDPHNLPSADHATEIPSRPLNPYRSARERAIVASFLIIAASVASIAGWLAQSQAILAAIDVQDQATADTPERVAGIAFDAVIPVSHLQLPLTALWVLLAVGALVAWAPGSAASSTTCQPWAPAMPASRRRSRSSRTSSWGATSTACPPGCAR